MIYIILISLCITTILAILLISELINGHDSAIEDTKVMYNFYKKYRHLYESEVKRNKIQAETIRNLMENINA